MAKPTEPMIREILRLIGGSGNVIRAGNCMTRLRLTLKDSQHADQVALKAIKGVMGVVESDDQLQVILGPGHAQTAAEMMNTIINNGEGFEDNASSATSTDLKDVASEQKKAMKAKQSSSFHKFLTKFATIFTPLIPGFISAGLLLGIATLLDQTLVAGVDNPNALLLDLIGYMKIFSKGLFTFLTLLIGYNAQQAFGGSGVNGAIIASLFLLHYDPAGTVGYYSGISDFFGVTIDPRGNIIGVLIAAILGAQVERFIRKFIPANLDMILTSGLTVMIMGALVYTVIMPLGGVLFEGMSWLFLNLNDNPIGAALLSGLFLISVVFGIHQGFVPVYFALVEQIGFNSLFPILAMGGAGQVGAALALYLRAEQGSMLREQVKGCIIPGFLGIGEPLIYGVTLPRMKPFITACVGGAMGGFFIGLVSYMGYPVGLNSVFGPSGLVAIPLMTSNEGIFFAMSVYVVGFVIACLGGLGATYFFGHKDVDLS